MYYICMFKVTSMHLGVKVKIFCGVAIELWPSRKLKQVLFKKMQIIYKHLWK